MSLPRLLPDEPLPPYAFVPGKNPHPVSDPAGHSHGVRPDPVPVPDPQRWRECQAYCRGIDLFNHGYYWEAHEAWEAAWQACGRRGTVADFFKGLIKLAAAGVKLREGVPEGARGHAARAAKLFRKVEAELGPRCFGLDLEQLVAVASDATELEIVLRPE
jgi:uncharacterized protein